MNLRRLSVLALAAVAGWVSTTYDAPHAFTAPASAAVKAFPGAEGFGTDTSGGRGGQVCAVTNLNDSGAGSLRACVEMPGPRFVVFRTGGTILLQDRISVTQPFITIAGQTAPGGGITLRMAPATGSDKGTMLVATHDVVIRYMRFRPGDGGAAGDSDDAMMIYEPGVHGVVVDHCSFSWAVDENVNTYDASSDVTISNSIIAEGLSHSRHPLGEHSKGLLSGGIDAHNVSIHHNLFVSNVDRNPQISGVSVADVRNNVVYNYGDGSGAGVTLLSSSHGQARMNWVGNYYKPGPGSDPARAEFSTYIGDTGATQQWYGAGNVRWTPTGNLPARIGETVGRVGTPFAAAPVTTTSAEQAYVDVLAGAGASRVRDAVDQRLVAEVRAGTGSFKDIPGPYPDLPAGGASADADGDGMPDDYEASHGTKPKVADATGDVDGNGYDNIEDWFNSTVNVVAPPRGTIAVNGGAARTRTTGVTLNLTASAGGTGTDVTQMRFSGDGATYRTWVSYTPTASWQLPAGNGTRTVWAQFADALGNVSAPVTDAITLDMKSPGVTKVRPAKGKTGVDRDVTIKVHPSEVLRSTSVTRGSVVLKRQGSSKKIRAKVAYRAAHNRILLNPKGDLDRGTTYTAHLSTAIRDLAGNALDAKHKPGAQRLTWRFTTR